jgi:predicted kinase
MRGRWIQLFLDYNARVKLVYIEVPYRKLIKQNANREYKVPQSVIDKMIWKLEIPTVREAHELAFIIDSRYLP